MIFNLERKTVLIPMDLDQIGIEKEFKILLDEIIDKTVIRHDYLTSESYSKIINIIKNNFNIDIENGRCFNATVVFIPAVAMINIELSENDFIPQVRNKMIIGSDRVISIDIQNKKSYSIDEINNWIPSLVPGRIFRKDNNAMYRILSLAKNPNDNSLVVVYEDMTFVLVSEPLFLPIEEFIDLIK